MRRDSRGVVFDLDDTLYPYRRFKMSGFLAVATHLHARAGLDLRLGFAAMAGASRGRQRGEELQACLAQHDLPAAWLPELLDVFRYHAPRLRLPSTSRRTLRTLRAEGWRLGVLTNGSPSIQTSKMTALGIAPFVDVITCATTVGRGEGKPDPDAFAHIARQLSVPASRVVFVGDDVRCDIDGARAAGMLPVHCRAWTGGEAEPARSALAITNRLTDMPAIATSLIEEASKSHAA